MVEKIPGFYYDLIARIAPGGLLIVIYYHPFIEKAYERSSGFLGGVVGSFAGLVCAYIVGYMIETVASVLEYLFHQRLSKMMGKRLFHLVPSNEIWEMFEVLEKTAPNKEFFNVKEIAERALFRTLSAVSMLAVLLEIIRIIWKWDVLSLVKATVPLLPTAECEYLYLWLVVGVALLSCLSFWKIWYFLSKRVMRAQKAVPESHLAALNSMEKQLQEIISKCHGK